MKPFINYVNLALIGILIFVSIYASVMKDYLGAIFPVLLSMIILQDLQMICFKEEN